MATEYNSVKMEDGRIVEFPGKRKMLKESMEQPDGTLAVRLDFVNGKTRTFPLHAALIKKFACHGAEQKYGDETAGVEDPDDMVEAVDSLHGRLSAGTWAIKREAGGFAGASIVIRAMAEVSQKSVAEVKAALDAKLEATEGLTRQALYASIRQSARFGPKIKELEAERAAKSKAPAISVDDLGL